MTGPLLSHCSFSKRKLGTHGPREPFNPKQTWTSVCVPGPEPQGALGPQTCPCKELSIRFQKAACKTDCELGLAGHSREPETRVPVAHIRALTLTPSFQCPRSKAP